MIIWLVVLDTFLYSNSIPSWEFHHPIVTFIFCQRGMAHTIQPVLVVLWQIASVAAIDTIRESKHPRLCGQPVTKRLRSVAPKTTAGKFSVDHFRWTQMKSFLYPCEYNGYVCMICIVIASVHRICEWKNVLGPPMYWKVWMYVCIHMYVCMYVHVCYFHVCQVLAPWNVGHPAIEIYMSAPKTTIYVHGGSGYMILGVPITGITNSIAIHIYLHIYIINVYIYIYIIYIYIGSDLICGWKVDPQTYMWHASE